MGSPRISILVPIYGEEPYFAETVESIERQTFTDYEIIAVLEKPSSSVVKELDRITKPVKRVHYKGSQGIAGALNRGIDSCSGDFIVRQDADDVLLPKRLEKQLSFMTSNPSVGVLGTSYELINESGERITKRYFPTTHLALRWRLLLSSPIPHPTAMIRHSVLKSSGIRYRPEFNSAEDFDLWTRLAEETKLRNLATPLLRYRVGSQQASTQNRETQVMKGDEIAVREVGRVLSDLCFSPSEVKRIRKLLYTNSVDHDEVNDTVDRSIHLFRAFASEFSSQGDLTEARNGFLARLLLVLRNSGSRMLELRTISDIVSLAMESPLSLSRYLYTARIKDLA